MFFVTAKKSSIILLVITVIVVILFSGYVFIINSKGTTVNLDVNTQTPEKKFIKYVEFNATYSLMEKAMKIDIESIDKDIHIDWITLLSYAAAKSGGNFNKNSAREIDNLTSRLQNNEGIADITKDLKYYNYYYEAYSAVLGGFVGGYIKKNPDGSVAGEPEMNYGLRVFHPIAKGFSYSHSDDFGNKRTYGYTRIHLGNDLFGSIGAPVIAIEGGIVEALGWNKYGGWRIGIRSHDNKRYYYYAHLRKNRPYAADLKEGDIIEAGQIIGYLGMTGYSTKENVNNITNPHLHFGMQLIFDESQKESDNEIWVNVYNIMKLLDKYRSTTVKNEETKEYTAQVTYYAVDEE